MAGLTLPAPRIPARRRTAARIVAGAAILLGTALAVGTAPFVQGIASVSPLSVLAALVLTALATAAAAARWRIVAAAFGLPLGWGEAFAAYYRSQFLNTVLPGGALGDVHRAWAHGQQRGRVDLAARAVIVERLCGQLVQLAMTLAFLVSLGFGASLAPLAWGGIALAGIILLASVAVASTRGGRDLVRREWHVARPVFSRARPILAVVACSAIVVGAHTATFVVAGFAAAAPRDLVVIALVVLCASAIPLNVGGWGPREAASASAFALAGLAAGRGVAVSTTFGVLTMIAVAPGALVLLVPRLRARRERRVDEIEVDRHGDPVLPGVAGTQISPARKRG